MPPEPSVRARKIFAPQPSYPEAARQAGVEGTVIVAGDVAVDGTIDSARVLRGVDPVLDRAALEAFRTWKMEPARGADGQPVDSVYRVGIHFRLEARRAVTPLPFGGDYRPPVRFAGAAPVYPREALANGTVGVVQIDLVVLSNGEVVDVTVIEGLPFGITEAALEAVRTWRFRPATRKGRPVAVHHRVSLRFAPS